VEAGVWPSRGQVLQERRKQAIFVGLFPYDRKPAFENKGRRRLKYLPENSDI
jgi:hypothetical protein